MTRYLALMAAAITISNANATEYELKWDTGLVHTYGVCVQVGAGFWWANDFDVSTLSTRYIDRVKIMSTGYIYPGWDGFRIAIFEFDRIPGSIIWPRSGVPKFVKGKGSAQWQWCEFDVGWTIPTGCEGFLVGQEQFFLPPLCDPYCFDDDRVRRLHTWLKDPTRPWKLWKPSANAGYNLMLRVILKGETGLAAASFGRIKALYR
jgi:hypothetical protein